MDTKEAPFVPVEQKLIPLAGHYFHVVLFHDGRIAAVLTQFCDALGFDRPSQVERIKANPILANCLLEARIETAGGPQVALVLIDWALPLWLAGFQVNRLSEEKRALILTLQRDAVDTFNSYFPKRGSATEARPQQQAQAPQPPPPLSRPEQTPTSLPEMLRAMADRVEQDQREDTARHNETERRVRVLEEEREAIWATITSYAPVTPNALTTDHQRTLDLLLRDHHLISGQPIAVLEEQLAALLGVEGVDHIPEAAWDRLFAWFWQRTLPQD